MNSTTQSVIHLDAFPVEAELVLAVIKDLEQCLVVGSVLHSPKSGMNWKVVKILVAEGKIEEVTADNPPANVIETLERDFQVVPLAKHLAAQGIREYLIQPIGHIGMPQKDEELMVEK